MSHPLRNVVRVRETDGADPRSGLLECLTPAQRRAVTTDAAPLCVLAGAGSGKTRVLTHRIAHRLAEGSADAGHVLVLTFTRKAAGELTRRLQDLGLRDRVVAGTFHAVGIAALRQYWSDRGQRPLVLLERKARILAPLISARPALQAMPVSEVAGHLEWAQARLVGPDDFETAVDAAGRRLPVPAAEVAAVYRRYEWEKVRRGLIDFDDVLARAAAAIETDPGFAGAQRWRWRHVFVDEFQDLNPAQHRLLLAWLGSSADLCAVGDPNQAIYAWNGADPDLLRGFTRRWPDAEVVHLDDNHRCSPQIVAAAASVLGADGASLRSARPDGSPPTVTAYATDEGEASAVADDVAAAGRAGRAWSSMAVLARTNTQVRVLARALNEIGVPSRVPGSADLLTDPVTERVLGALRSGPDRPARMAAADLAEAAAGAEDDHERDVLTCLSEQTRLYHAVDASGRATGLAAWLIGALARDRDGASAANGVTVCSFHRAKGLEWDTVWVCGLEEGLVPIGHATTPAAVDEERRLLYVALTRAGSHLHLSWARRRSFTSGGFAVPRRPSPWLGAIDERADDRPRPEVVDTATWRARLVEQRRGLRDGRAGAGAVSARPVRLGDGHSGDGRSGPQLAPGDARVEAALRAWRADAARASGVPAHVLLHDRTLAALASLAPTTTEELADVPGLGPVKAARYGPALLALLGPRRASA